MTFIASIRKWVGALGAKKLTKIKYYYIWKIKNLFIHLHYYIN